MSNTQLYWNLQLLLSIIMAFEGFRLNSGIFNNTFYESVVIISVRRKVGDRIFPHCILQDLNSSDLWVRQWNDWVSYFTGTYRFSENSMSIIKASKYSPIVQFEVTLLSLTGGLF